MKFSNRSAAESAPDSLLGRAAFTLVELLVVIGIIALLISILLPALGKAKQQANIVKCATQLREIGNSFRLYATEYKNYFPPAKLTPTATPVSTYSIQNYNFTNGVPAFWINFLNKYVSKGTVGNAAASAAEANDIRNRSVLWGCPNWEPYTSTTSGVGIQAVQTGYGMNAYPYWTPQNTTYPSDPAPALGQPYIALPNGSDTNVNYWSITNPSVGFIKASIWDRHGAERMLVSESKYFQCWTAAPVPASPRGVPQSTYVGVQNGQAQNATGNTDQQSYFSYWRHGKLPANENSTASGTKPDGSGYMYDTLKGKLTYNVLYCDGHVSTATDAKTSYMSFLMKH